MSNSRTRHRGSPPARRLSSSCASFCMVIKAGSNSKVSAVGIVDSLLPLVEASNALCSPCTFHETRLICMEHLSACVRVASHHEQSDVLSKLDKTIDRGVRAFSNMAYEIMTSVDLQRAAAITVYAAFALLQRVQGMHKQTVGTAYEVSQASNFASVPSVYMTCTDTSLARDRPADSSTAAAQQLQAAQSASMQLAAWQCS